MFKSLALVSAIVAGCAITLASAVSAQRVESFSTYAGPWEEASNPNWILGSAKDVDHVMLSASKFAIHDDGTLTLMDGATIEQAAQQAAEAFVNYDRDDMLSLTCVVHFVMAGDNGWSACTKPSGEVTYTGRILPDDTRAFIETFAKISSERLLKKAGVITNTPDGNETTYGTIHNQSWNRQSWDRTTVQSERSETDKVDEPVK